MTLTAILFIILPLAVLSYGLYKHIYDWGLSIKLGSSYWSVGRYIWLIILASYLFIVMFIANNISHKIIADAMYIKGSGMVSTTWYFLVLTPPIGFFLAFFPHIYLKTLEKNKKARLAKIKSILAICSWYTVTFIILNESGKI